MYSLNILKADYAHSWHPSCVLSNIRQFFRNCRYAWQRATKGYCDRDVWWLGEYQINLGVHMLEDLAKIHCGFPCGVNGIKTDEEWVDTINNIAAVGRGAVDEDLYPNPYEKDYFDWLHEHTVRSLTDCPYRAAYHKTEADNEREMYENGKVYYELMAKWFPHLWD